MSLYEMGETEQSLSDRLPIPTTANGAQQEARLQAIQNVVEQTRTKAYDNDFVSFTIQYIKGIEKHFPDALHGLRGEGLVDLGAGRLNHGLDLAIRYGANRYVAVDLYVSESELSQREAHFYRAVSPDHPMELAQEKKDMLLFLAKQADNSANILLNGIDYTIIESADYGRWLVSEIARVAGKDHSVIGGGSKEFLNQLVRYSFTSLDPSLQAVQILRYRDPTV